MDCVSSVIYVGAEVCPGDTVSYECVNEDYIEWIVYCHTSPSSSENFCQSMSIPDSLAAVLTEPRTAVLCNTQGNIDTLSDTFMASYALGINNSATLNITAPSSPTTQHLGILCDQYCQNFRVAGKQALNFPATTYY